jgi:hypothetical protein
MFLIREEAGVRRIYAVSDFVPVKPAKAAALRLRPREEGAWHFTPHLGDGYLDRETRGVSGGRPVSRLCGPGRIAIGSTRARALSLLESLDLDDTTSAMAA